MPNRRQDVPLDDRSQCAGESFQSTADSASRRDECASSASASYDENSEVVTPTKKKKKNLLRTIKKFRACRKSRKKKKKKSGDGDSASMSSASSIGSNDSSSSGGSGEEEEEAPPPMHPVSLTAAYIDFEERALESFHRIHAEAADAASEANGVDTQFSAILRACNTILTSFSSSYFVKEEKEDFARGKVVMEASSSSASAPDSEASSVASSNASASSSSASIPPPDPAPPPAPRYYLVAPPGSMDLLWTLCVANVCSGHILQQIGGPEGHRLSDLAVTQLLDLMSWIEYFLDEVVGASFPRVSERAEEMAGGGGVAAKGDAAANYFDLRMDLVGITLDMDDAIDNLASIQNMLWEVHRLTQGEYLHRMRDQTDSLLDSVYRAKRVPLKLADGPLTVSLCEDVISLVNVQLKTTREHLTSRSSEALLLTFSLILSYLGNKQMLYRDNFLIDFEYTCAAASDFLRMGNKIEEVLADFCQQCDFSDDARRGLEDSTADLVALYSADAVFAAQSLHTYIFEPMYDQIADEKLFGRQWEDEWTYNEVALSVVRTIEDFFQDLDNFLHDEMLLRKTLQALVFATVVFYVRCLLVKAERHSSSKVGYFGDTSKALTRIEGDIWVMRHFFEGFVPNVPSIGGVVEKQFLFLTVIHECMSIAATADMSNPASSGHADASDFIIFVHKYLHGNINLTKHFVGDLWHLMNPSQEQGVLELIALMEDDLDALFAQDGEFLIRQSRSGDQRSQMPASLMMDSVLKKMYAKSIRRLPIHSSALDKMVDSLKLDWVAEKEQQLKRVKDRFSNHDDFGNLKAKVRFDRVHDERAEKRKEKGDFDIKVERISAKLKSNWKKIDKKMKKKLKNVDVTKKNILVV